MEKNMFGDSLISRLECFKEITESTTNFDEERAKLVLSELKDIMKQGKYGMEGKISQDMSMSDRIAIREFLELAMILNARIKDYKEIRKYYEYLKSFYFYDNDLPQSQRMFMLIDLSLLVDLLLESKFKKLNGHLYFQIKSSSKNTSNRLFDHHTNSYSGLNINTPINQNNQTDINDQLTSSKSSNSANSNDQINTNDNNSKVNQKSDETNELSFFDKIKTEAENNSNFYTDLAQIQARFQNNSNLYLDYILQINECIRNNSIQTFFLIRKRSPSVLFDDILAQILDNMRQDIVIDILSHSFSDSTDIIKIQKLLKFTKIEDARQLLQSLHCRISKDGMVTAPIYYRLSQNRHYHSPHSIAFMSVMEPFQANRVSISRSDSGNISNLYNENYSNDEHEEFFEIDQTIDIYRRFDSLKH